jgi:hypothetical protein
MNPNGTLWNLVKGEKMFWMFIASVLFFVYLLVDCRISKWQEKEKVRLENLHQQMVEQKIIEL